jgi:hypothetical protein
VGECLPYKHEALSTTKKKKEKKKGRAKSLGHIPTALTNLSGDACNLVLGRLRSGGSQFKASMGNSLRDPPISKNSLEEDHNSRPAWEIV